MNATPIHRHQGTLFMDQVNLKQIAEHYGTPCYVYSRQGIRQRWQAFDTAFAQQPHLVCYAVKTNSNLAVLQTLAQAGAGFDIVSGGELARVLKAGGAASKVVFSGVGKSEAEIARILNVSQSSISRSLKICIKKLKEILKTDA